MTPSLARRAGGFLLAAAALVTLVAPVLAPHAPGAQFADHAYAPPMRVHVRDASGWRAPFVYRLVLVDRISHEYREDVSAPRPLLWLRGGRLVSLAAPDAPLMLLGGDPLGRDVFSRLVLGAGLSLGVALAGALGALALGTLVGGLAGALGGRADGALMLVADFVLVLPAVYLVLVLRSVLPPVLSTVEVFGLLALLFTVAAWPHVARGVRAIVATERTRDYAEAARAAGAGPLRLAGHLVPAAFGFLATEAALLLPALLAAESTISFLGLGFPEPIPSWGTMLQDAGNVSVMREAPWMLAPAAAIFVVVLAVQLAAGRRASALITAPDTIP